MTHTSWINCDLFVDDHGVAIELLQMEFSSHVLSVSIIIMIIVVAGLNITMHRPMIKWNDSYHKKHCNCVILIIWNDDNYADALIMKNITDKNEEKRSD